MDDAAEPECHKSLFLILSTIFVFCMLPGVVSADVEDEIFGSISKTPQPYVEVSLMYGSQEEGYTYLVKLKNNGEVCSNDNEGDVGVHLEAPPGGYFYDILSSSFSSYQGFYSDGTKTSSVTNSEILELYAKGLESGSVLFATVVVKPGNSLADEGSIDIKYRGWIIDRNTRIVNPTVEIYDPWFGRIVYLNESYIARYPYDYPDSRWEGPQKFKYYRTIPYQSIFPQAVTDAAESKKMGNEVYKILRKNVNGENKYAILYRDTASNDFTGSLVVDQSGNVLGINDFPQEFAELFVLNIKDYRDIAEEYTERYYLRSVGAESYADLIGYAWFTQHAVMAFTGYGLIIFDTTSDFVSPLKSGAKIVEKHTLNNFLKILLQDLMEDIAIELGVGGLNKAMENYYLMMDPLVKEDIKNLHNASDSAERIFTEWSEIYTYHSYPDLKRIAIGMAFGYDSTDVLLRMYTWNTRNILVRAREYYPHLVNISNLTEAIESLNNTIDILENEQEQLVLFAYSIMTEAQELRNKYRANCDNDNDGYLSLGCGGDDCDDSNPDVHPGATELCNGIDDNCDGSVDPGCSCEDGQTKTCGSDVGECQSGTRTCSNGEWGPCEGVIWGSQETCPHDGKDNDCDGQVDENECDNDFPENVCYDWYAQPTDGILPMYIEEIRYGPYCANGYEWHIHDVDNDGYTERYMLTGETYRAWFLCRATPGYTVGGFTNYVGSADYPCYDEECDGRVERFLWRIEKDSPSPRIDIPEIFCDVEGHLYGYYGNEIYYYWDSNGNEKYDPGEHIEYSMVLNCGVDDDCGPGKYCDKTDSTPWHWECKSLCGNGVCEPGEECLQDGSGPEVCDGRDNDCDGDVDEGLGSTICGEGVCRHTVQNCMNGFEQVCDPFEGASPEVYDGLDNDCDGGVDEDWTYNTPPTSPIIIHPNCGDYLNESVIIEWTPSSDADNNPVRYYLDYSDDGGNSWNEIVSDYLFTDKFTISKLTEYNNNWSSESKDIIFDDMDIRAIRVPIPKGINISSASFYLNGYALPVKVGYDGGSYGYPYTMIYGYYYYGGGNYEPSYFLHKDLPDGCIDSWEIAVDGGGMPSGKLEICSTYAESLATSREEIEAQCDDSFVMVNDDFSLNWGFSTTNFSSPYYPYTDSVILKTYSLEEANDGVWGFMNMLSVGADLGTVYQYGYEMESGEDRASEYKFAGKLGMNIYPHDVRIDFLGGHLGHTWERLGEFDAEYLPVKVNLDVNEINELITDYHPYNIGELIFSVSSSSNGILRVSNLEFYSDKTDYVWDVRDLPEGSYNVRVRAYDSYHFSEWDESDCEFVIIHSSADNDLDGYNETGDCNDNNPNIHPGAQEVCNGMDDDCDGVVDGNLTRDCGTGDCEGTQVCTGGVWGNCSSEGQICEDGLFCNVGETCHSGVCNCGYTRNCSEYSLPEIATCYNDPDGIDYTWDYSSGFASVCDEEIDMCTMGNHGYIHTCDKARCGAECEYDSDCPATECDNLDGCHEGTYRDYDDEENTCLANCTCTVRVCSDYNEIITDDDGDGYDIECDNDCDDLNPDVNPGETEVCDGLDNDCDGATDEGCEIDISIYSPENRTYDTSEIDLVWDSSSSLEWCAYSLNGGENTDLCFPFVFKGKPTNSMVHGIFSDDNYIYTGYDHGGSLENLLIYYKENLTFVRSLSLPIEGYDVGVPVKSIFADDEYLYASQNGGPCEVFIWDKNSNFDYVTKLSDASDVVYDLYVDDAYLYGASTDGSVYVYDKTDFSLVEKLTEGTMMHGVMSDGNYIYGTNHDGNLYIWDKSDFSLYSTLTVYYGDYLMDVHVDDEYIYASAYTLGEIYVWYKNNLTKKASLFTSYGYLDKIYADDEYIYGGNYDGKVYIFSKETLSLYKILAETTEMVFGVYADYDYVYAAAMDGLYLWNQGVAPVDTSITAQNGQNSLIIYVTDVFGNSGQSDYVYFTVEPNNPPVLEPIGDVTIYEGELVMIIANATDADGDVLTYQINDSRFTQNENIFTWQTGFSDGERFKVEITVSDGEFSDSEEITVSVINNDKDDDGYNSTVDCDDNNAAIHPGAQETCNGIDDDCDGSADEDWPELDDECSVGVGACHAEGIYICAPDGSGMECNAEEGTPSDELCNGIDDDCDGMTEDDGEDEPWYHKPTACGIGECASNGQFECTNGEKVDTCTLGEPSSEICDNLDNNCDGLIDEDLTRECSNGNEYGICYGNETCESGGWVGCDAPVPEDEICDGLDNDCDGSIDESGDSLCDDGFWCNGRETCGGFGGCQNGTAPDCNDGVDCTEDSCDEGNDVCVNIANDSFCDDGLYCDGVERCDAALGCQAGTPVDCSDSVVCTMDSCNEDTDSCDNVPNDNLCNDGLWCNGEEYCDSTLDCQMGTQINCSDGVMCTEDSCDEDNDVCSNVPDDGLCDDGLYCDGVERCDAALGCQAGTLVDCSDGVDCTGDSCNEDMDSCDNVPDDSMCDDGLWCNGIEACDALKDCQAGIPVDCSDDLFCTVNERCDEGSDSCVSDGRDCSSNDITGLEECFHSPDSNPFTWDYREAFESVCDEVEDKCTEGDETIMHKCSVSMCSADCDSNLGCSDYCEGDVKHTGMLCDTNSTCTCLEGEVFDCSSLDGMYETGNFKWVDSGQCQEEKLIELEKRNYNCMVSSVTGAKCIYPSGNLVWVNTGETRDKEDGTECDDGLFCTVNDHCIAGVCGGDARDCSDVVGCTGDSCNEVTDSCDNVPDDSMCDDGLWCNGIEACDALKDCQAGIPVDCSDDLFCTVNERCDEGSDSCVSDGRDCSSNDITGLEECFHSPDSNPFTWDYREAFESVCDEAGDVCTGGSETITHECSVESCGAECDPTHQCEENSCEETYHDYCDGKKLVEYDGDRVLDSMTMTDSCGNACLVDCTCEDCSVDCSAPETNAYCVKDVCGAECADSKDCDDSDPYTLDNCLDGCTCSHEIIECVNDDDCDDGNACTDDVCNIDMHECEHVNNNNPCDDGLWCNGPDQCQDGSCVNAGPAIDCDDMIACTKDSCNEVTDSCDNVPDDSMCDDGLWCNGIEACDALKDCQAGIPVDCSDDLFCTVNERCDEGSDSCVSDGRDCSSNDITGLEECFHSPDSNPFTWDYREAFESVCDEAGDVCTSGSETITHECSVESCGAECDPTHQCGGMECDDLDGCFDGTYRDYADSTGTCLDDCTCTTHSCDDYEEIITDNDGDGYDIECDNDCDDSDPGVNPGATEVCDGRDNDCDGTTDEGCPGPSGPEVVSFEVEMMNRLTLKAAANYRDAETPENELTSIIEFSRAGINGWINCWERWNDREGQWFCYVFGGIRRTYEMEFRTMVCDPGGLCSEWVYEFFTPDEDPDNDHGFIRRIDPRSQIEEYGKGYPMV